MRGTGWSSLLRRRENLEFPVHVYIVEHPDGHIAIDTGMNAQGWSTPLAMRRASPSPITEPGIEIGPQMQARGLSPEDVRTVVLTHLDLDHVGGIGDFADAEFVVHRPEYDSRRRSWAGCGTSRSCGLRLRPDPVRPRARPLRPVPREQGADRSRGRHARSDPGPFDRAGRRDPANGGHRAVLRRRPRPSPGLVRRGLRAGRLLGLGALTFPKPTVETSRRVHRFAEEVPTVLLPAHDAEAPATLAAKETVKF